MFSTKIEVDRHVENCLKKLNSEAERNVRCFAFAKLYFKIGEYEQTRRYVSMYLNAKPASAEAQQLLGKALEKIGKKEQALEAYRTSLELDPKQNSLVIKICELLASDDVYFDKCGARYYCEKAQTLDPHNPAVFSLKERLISSESKDPSDVSKLLLKELEARPTDVDIRIRLLRHLLQHNQIKEAYKHAFEIEQKSIDVFLGNLTWYETVAEVLVRYQRDPNSSNNLSWEFWFVLVSVLDKVVSLSMDERSINIKNSSEYIIALFNFDQTLKTASENIQGCPEKHLVQEFLNHYRGQLCFHLATLIYKQAKKELIPYKEISLHALPLLFAAYHVQPVDLQSLWLDHASEQCRKQVQRWHKEAAFRCSQAGHILLVTSKDRKNIILEKATQGTSGMWREQIFKKLFVTRNQQAKIESSYFATCNQLTDVLIRLPEPTSLSRYDEIAQLMHPESLHYYIWTGLNQKLSQYKCAVFEGLQYSIKNLHNCAAETLNVLDIQSFIYCSILCAQSQLEESKNSYYFNPNKPQIFPASITDHLGTINQSKWLTAAYKMYKNEPSASYNDLRLVLIRGIEVIRCMGNHGLNVKLLVSLANAFSERAKLLTKHTEIEFCEARAELYWKAALPQLEKLKNNQSVTSSYNRLFEYKCKELTHAEILHHIDSGKLFNATQLMKKKENEKALKIFDQLKDPYASFYQAQIYKNMADEQTNQSKENLTSEMRSQNIILLSRARDYLYLTLDRLRDPTIDKQHPLNTLLGTEIEKVERLLSRIDPDISVNRNECDGMSDENTSSIGSMPENIGASFSVQNQSFLNGISPRHQDLHTMHTPYRLENSFRREARPSPERLDAQLRQLAASKDAVLTNILEQNKYMVEAHKSLVDELRSFKDVVTNLTTTVNEIKSIKNTVEELKGVKQSVEELKTAVDDLQNFRNISDVVYEMKKELSELKKDASKIKNNQLSDEDLYVLDDDYASDYNINVNAVALNPNLYPNLQGRLQGANNLAAYAPPLYTGPMYPMYSYPGLGLPQGGPLTFADPSQMSADFRVGSFSQPLQQNPQQTTFPPAIPPLQVQQPPSGISQQITPGNLAHSLLQGPGLPHPSYHKEPATTSASILPGQGLLNILPTTTSTQVPSSKAPPLNVVITSSEPLPTTKTTSTQPILSVTIPPQHLKGNLQKPQPHNYQIPLPTTGSPSISTPSVINQSPMPVSTQSLLSNVAPPIYSAISDKSPQKSVGLGLQIEKSLSQSFNNSMSKQDISNSSTVSVEENDPCPDFKPIIPLPDEVAVNTGEENETVLFSERARLYRFVDKEWRERGIGVIKILKSNETGKIRLLMRRDQVHKICANHFITKDMELKLMPKSDRAFMWAAHDFADEQFVLEKLCVRFKTVEEASKFKKVFEKAASEASDETPEKSVKEAPKTEIPVLPNNSEITITPVKPAEKQLPVSSFGGFVFTSTPTFQPKVDVTPVKTAVVNEVPKASPFASFTFSTKTATTPPNLFSSILTSPKTTESAVTITKSPAKVETETKDDSHVDEFVPNVEFKPVVPLPDLVEIKTGEENAEVLFEHKAKLLRFDTTAKEWKERGIGIMKILKENIVRFVMRREQVHKVCCNHQLMKIMNFSKMDQSPKTVTWCAKDFSEGELRNEAFAIRFKTEDITDSFLAAVEKAKSLLDENNQVMVGSTPKKAEEKKSDKKSKSQKYEPLSPTTTNKGLNWGDKFKPKAGSWECKNCYIVNEGKENYCVACDTPKNETIPKKSNENNTSGPQFSFGVASSQGQSFGFGQKTATTGWGDALKTKPGSWECKTCYIRNDAENQYCVSCEEPKDESVPPKDSNKGVNLDTGGLSFSFGVQNVQTPSLSPNSTTGLSFGQKATTSGWGDLLKTKAGSWECKTCYIRNDAENEYCVSCEEPKDETVPPKDSNKGVNLDTGGLSFSFGVPNPKNSTSAPKSTTFGTTTLFGQKTTTTGWGDAFKTKPGSWECGTCYIRNDADNQYCASCDEPKDATVPPKDSNKGVNLDTGGLSFSFGVPSAKSSNTPATPTNTPTVTSTFSFGTPAASKTTTGFSFGATTVSSESPLNLSSSKPSFTFKLNVPTVEEVKPVEASKEQFVFGSPQKHDFEFTPRSPRRHSGGHGDDESDGSYVEEENDTIYFKPVIPLPDKIVVKTGEEEEVTLYCHRAKLFRFVQGEWKERGIGDIKILKMPTTNRLRVLMRREKILKICLNHVLTKDIEYLPKDDKTWLFGAPDFSEGEISHDKFCLRFKNAEVAQEFKKAIDEALNNTQDAGTKSDVKVRQPSSDSDVEFVCETEVSKEEQDEARRLMLPPKFMSYRQLPDCTCAQCLKEDELLKDSINLSKKPSVPDTPSNRAFGTPNSGSIFGTPSSWTSALSSQTKDNSFSTPSTKELTVKDLLNSSPAVSSSTDSAKSFTFKLDQTPENKLSNSPLKAMEETKPQSNPFGFNTGNLFSSPQTQTNISSTGSIFGMSPNTSGNLFGPKPTTSIFGTNKPNSSIFGGANLAQPVFGASAFSTTVKTEASTPLFGSSSTPSFGSLAASGATPSFGSLAQSEKNTTSTEEGEIVLKCDSNLSFATLAATSNKTGPPAFAVKSDDKNPFGFLGAGAPVFGGAKNLNKSNQKSEKAGSGDEAAEEEGGGGGGDEYDPHYEPIVPLPDAIVVTTGEEEEAILFNERSKLYRYDSELKEWKERGVGQLKLLHHPQKGTYRLILRREQVHKLVLNMLLTPQVDFQPMSTSDKSYCWIGYNFVDEPAVEKLAARFKSSDLANQFYGHVQVVIKNLEEIEEKKKSASLPSTLENYGLVGGGDAPEDDGEDDYEQEDETEDYYDNDERSIMFTSRCSLSVGKPEDNTWNMVLDKGDIRIYYDSDFYGSCIAACDDTGLVISKTIIGTNTLMSVNGCDCYWRAVEWANNEFQWKNFKATFDSEEEAINFHLSYEEGLQYAEESAIIDDIPREHAYDVRY